MKTKQMILTMMAAWLLAAATPALACGDEASCPSDDQCPVASDKAGK